MVRVVLRFTGLCEADGRATLAAARANGGKVLMQPYRIEGVGEVAYFEDTEGNICGVAQYLPGLWK